jgi:hypothetical protein
MRCVARPPLGLAFRPLSQEHRPGEEPGRVAGRGRWRQAASLRPALGATNHALLCARGLKRAIGSEDDGVRGLEILNEIGDQAIVDNNEPEGKWPVARLAEVDAQIGVVGT